MRLLFITRKFPPSVGGMEVYSKELDDAMRKAGADVELFKPRHPMMGRPSLLQMSLFFVRACMHVIRRRNDYDAILIGDFALGSLACVAKLATRGRARIAVSLHGQDLYFMRRRSAVALAYRMIAKLVVMSGAIDIGIANSHAIRDEASKRGISRLAIVPLATSLPEMPDVVRTVPPYLLFAGRLIGYKGLSWFVERVWPHLDSRLELHVAGETWDEREQACLAGQPRIRYLGKIDHDHLPALRATAVACIMPNLPPGPREQDEGFGLSALEAAAVGTPIVATRTGGLPDAVVEGITGFLLPPLDVDRWVTCINDITAWPDEKRRQFAVRARTEIAQAYNWDLVARRTLHLLAGHQTVPAKLTFR
jgi:glycosyltransferase involved in cell wall biosynthesis